MKTDIEINGHGFYCIIASSKRGERFMTRVQGNDHGVAYCDDSRLTQDIADGAHARGLRLRVNGRRYLGNGAVAKAVR